MRYARVQLEKGIFFAEVVGDDAFLLKGDPICGERSGESVSLSQCELLAPCLPSKIVCVGLNYVDHISEMKHDSVPDDPVIFIKPDTCVLDPGKPIVRPAISKRVDFEGELAVVIGKTCRDVSADEADEYILGYTVLNDVTARDLQKKDGQWTRGKGFDTFAPFGPFIETDFDPEKPNRIRAVRGGDVLQDSTTNLMIRKPRELIAFISAVMTLKPFDVVATGTPAGVAPLVAGDTITIEIEGLCSLTNPVTD